MFHRWREGLLAAASTSLALAAFEGGLRLAQYEPAAGAAWGSSPFEEVADERRYAFVPGYSGRFGGADIAINSWRFRGPPPDVDAGSSSIAVIGDSVAFGVGVPFQATFCEELERLLGGVGRTARVSNLGVPGYDTLQEVASLELIWDAVRPRLIVLQFSLNDAEAGSWILGKLSEGNLYRSSGVSRSRILQLMVKSLHRRRVESFHRWANDPDVFRTAYVRRIDSLDDDSEIGALMQNVGSRFAPNDWPVSFFADREHVGRIRHAFAELRRFAGLHRAQVVVLIVPLLEQTGTAYGYRPAHEVVAHEARRAGFSVVDPTDAFLERGMVELRATPDDDVHPGVSGHAILARALVGPVTKSLSAP